MLAALGGQRKPAGKGSIRPQAEKTKGMCKFSGLFITIILQFLRKSVTIKGERGRKGWHSMMEILENLAANLTDLLIYAAIAIVALIGVFKCVLPVSRVARRLRRGIHLLETATGEGRPVWQDVLFLGKEIQGPWRRFLVNAAIGRPRPELQRGGLYQR